MDSWTLREHARTAIEEAVAWYTVAIDVSLASENGPNWGTGSLIQLEKRLFILTCRHVVEPQYEEKGLRFLYRNDNSLRFVEKDDIKKWPIHKIDKAYPQTVPIINRFYSDEIDDLVLLEIDSSSPEIKDWKFHQVAHPDLKTPMANTQVFLMGFSIELARTVTKHGDKGLFLYFDATKIIEKDVYSKQFDTQKHFLIDFTINEDSVDPHGLSGCGVWSCVQLEKDKLWTANLYLCGVESAYFEKSRVLMVTKVERLLQMINDYGLLSK